MSANTISLRVALAGFAQFEAGMTRITKLTSAMSGALAGGGILLGANKLMNFTQRAIEGAGNVGKLAQMLGQTTEEMSRLGFATRKTEDEMQGLFRNALKYMAEHGRGNESLSGFLLELSTQFQNLPDGAVKSAKAVEIFGRAGLDMIPFLDKGPEGIKALYERAEKLGSTSAEAAAKSRVFSAAQFELKHATGELSETIASTFAPTLTTLMKAMTEVVARVRQVIEASPVLQQAIVGVAGAVTALSTAFALNQIIAFAGLTGHLATAMGLLGKAVLAVGAGFVGWQLGRMIGSLELFGMTIDQRITASILAAQLAWEKLQRAFGADNAAQIVALQAALNQTLNPPIKGAAAAQRATATGLSSEQEMKDKRALLDLEIAGNKLAAEKQQLTLAGIRLEESRYAMIEGTEAAVRQKLALAGEAFNKGLIDGTEYRKLALDDQKHLLELTKERFAVILASDRATMESIRNMARAEDATLSRVLNAISSDYKLTATEKRTEQLRFLGMEADSARKKYEDLKASIASLGGDLTPERRTELEGGLNVLGERMAAVGGMKSSLEGTMNPESIRQNLEALMASWGTFQENVARGFTDIIGGAISSISNGITGLIMRTQTWGQALAQIGTSILTSIVGAIVQMGVRWVATQLMMFMFGKALAASAVAALTPIAIAQSAVWATPAALATIASYGSAALAAPGQIGGAIGATKALGVFGGAFAAGGTPPMGRVSLVGERGPELFVPHTPGLILPAGQTSELLGGAGGGGGNQDVRMNLAVFDDKRRIADWARSSDGRAVLLDIYRQELHEITGRA